MSLNSYFKKCFQQKASVWILSLGLPWTAFADGETPVSDGLQYLINALTGTTGEMLATLSVMMVGLLCLSHFLKWTVLFYTIAGIGIVFGASSMVSHIVGLIHS